MLEPSESTVPEPNPFGALRRHILLVVVLVGMFAALGAAFAAFGPERYVATASLVVENPRGSTLSAIARAADTERYVANQVALLKSAALAAEASKLSQTLDAPRFIGPGELIADARIVLIPETEFITISFEADDPVTARVGADSLALAYQQAVRASLDEQAGDATRSIDTAIDAVVSQIDSLQAGIDAIRSDDERGEIDAQVPGIVSDLVRLRETGPPPDGIDVRIEQLTSELRARLLVGELDAQQGTAAVLLRRQADALELLSQLNSRRGRIALQEGLAGDGVALYTPAGEGQPTGIALLPAVIVAGIVGGLLGAGLSYWLEGRKWRFSSRLEPEKILKAPALVQIPDFGDERPPSRLPVRDAPASAAAESFRFLMVGMDPTYQPMAESVQPRPGWSNRSIAVVSGTLGEGKTTIVANTALAAAREGLRVLVLDADVGNQDLTLTLVDHAARVIRPGLGITDMVAAGESFANVVNVISLGDAARLSVLSYGQSPVDPASFFRSAETAAALNSIRSRFDLFLVDVPPLLHVAYAAALLRLVDDVVVVVPHGGESGQLREVRDRLDLLGIHPIGYVYNRVPPGKKPAQIGSLSSVRRETAAQSGRVRTQDAV